MLHFGVIPELSFLMGNPPDPVADVESTISFIRQLKRIHPGCEIVLYFYTPVPLAGELYDRAQAEGFAFPKTLDEWVSDDWQDFSQRRSAHVPWIDDPL